MPTPDPNAPDSPPLRGLNPAALIGILSDGKRARPAIPGWEIESVLGEGGLGIVWRARRLADGVFAAVKVPRVSEIEHIERLELEAATLRALTHPHIVRLLESGPLNDGGMFLALEYIDGPALSHALPAAGFEPARAFDLFHQIAAAVAHAHEQGVIHRDLKPANILLAPDGTARVADFGLARPVHERVQHLSLTHTGLVAGTAEYLPPEAYRSDYVPGVKGDIYALGIILHEMLTGFPPRGAWHTVSRQRRVDIRIDDFLHRALAPDPSARWSSVEEMLRALDEIEHTPPRYSGTPLVTPTIRAADCAWTILGLLICLAAIGVEMRMALVRIPWPIDLVGPHGRFTGGMQALWWLSLAFVPVALWQIIRLIHFRAIPLREALPAPFGLRLGTTRTAATLVLLAQLLCLILPTLLFIDIFQESNRWLQPGDPPTRAGLVVTKLESDEPLDPRSTPENGAHYWLKEHRGLPGEPLSRHIDRVDFYPGLMPRTLDIAAAIIALAVVGTDIVVILRWWPYRRKRSLALLAITLATGTWIFWPEPKAPELTLTEKVIRSHNTHADEKGLYVELSDKVFATLYANPPPTPEKIEKEVMPYYPGELRFRYSERILHSEVRQRLIDEANAARAERRTAQIVGKEWFAGLHDPGSMGDMLSPYFHNRVTLLVTTENRERQCTADWIMIEHVAAIDFDRKTIQILEEYQNFQVVYKVFPRDLLARDAEAWARDFVAAIGHPPAPGTRDPLVPLIASRCYVTNEAWRNTRREQRYFKQMDFISLLRTTLSTDRSNTRPALADPPTPAERQPGARQRITFPVLDANGVGQWQADLIFQDGHWRAVTVRF